MKNVDRFREKIQEHFKATGIKQVELATSLDVRIGNYTGTKLSRQLNKKVALSDREALEIIKGMVAIRAVKKYSDVQILLEIMEVEFDEGDWKNEPLAKIKDRPATDFQKRYVELEQENRLLRGQLQVSKETAEREQEVAAARVQMEKAENSDEQLVAYRRALQADQNLALIHVLDMSRPLSLREMYIKLRLHEHKKNYQLEAELVEAEAKVDPNEHIRAMRLLLTRKVSKAYEPAGAIRENKHIVVLGDPGAGKTTMMKYLALRSVRGELEGLPDFPVHVILSRLATDLKKASDNGKDFSLIEWIAGYWQERYNFPKEAAKQLLEERMQAGEAIVLLDGLDETVTGGNDQAANESYDRVTNLIQNFTNHYPQVKVIVTVRFAGFSGNLPGFTQLEVLDFTSEDINQFVNSWYKHAPEQAKELNEQLRNNPRVETLAANPLLLTLIAIVFESYQGLPKTRTELYKECVETLLKKWDSGRRIKRVGLFGVKQKENLLIEIGWHFHKCRQRYLPSKILLSAISDFLPIQGLDTKQSEQILHEIAAEHGLLKEQANGWYGFLHLTLQEYFAALYATTNADSIHFFVEHRDDFWWKETILLYVGETADASPFLRELYKLVETGQDDIFHSALELAGECLAIRPNLRDRKIKVQIVEQFFKFLTDEGEYAVNRNNLISKLLALKEKEILVRLIPSLRDVNLDKNTHSMIVSAISNLKDSSTLPRLLELAADETLDKIVRYSVASAIGNLKDSRVLPKLLELAADETLDKYVRSGIASAIGNLKDTSVLPKLLELAADETLDKTVRVSIISSIGNLKDTSVLPKLLELAADETLDRFHIGMTIGFMAEHKTLPKLIADETLDKDLRFGIALVVSSVTIVGDSNMLPNLLELVADETLDKDVRTRIVAAISHLKDSSTLPKLLELVADENLHKDIRARIALVIGNLKDSSALPRLLELAADETLDKIVQINITISIGNLGDSSVLPKLFEWITDESLDNFTRRMLTNSVISLKDSSTLPKLLELVVDETLDKDIRREMATTIDNLGDSSILPNLLELVVDEALDKDVRLKMATTIGNLGDSSILPNLLELVVDEALDKDVRSRIAEAGINLVRTIEDLEQVVQHLQQWDVSDKLHQTAQRLGTRLFWQDVKTKTIKIEIINYD